MKRGQWIALVIAIGWMAVVIVLAVIGLKWPSALLGVVQLIGLVLYFLFGQRRKKDGASAESAEKRNELPPPAAL
jgi:hypothetical protein